MTCKLVDVRYNTMWILDDEIVIVNRVTPDILYFTEDMNQPIYEMNVMYVVEGESK